MKKIKLLILLLVVLLISGCSGTYNLDINKDLSVKEDLNVVLENEAGNYDKLNNLFRSNNIDEDKYKITTEGSNLKVNYKEKYSSIEDYLLNSFLYRQLFENISYNTDRKEFSLGASNTFNNTNSKLNYGNSIKLLQINVNTPLRIIDENSDSSSDDTYSWTIDNKTKEKELYIDFREKNRIFNLSTSLLLISFAFVTIVCIGIVVKKLLDSKKI